LFGGQRIFWQDYPWKYGGFKTTDWLGKTSRWYTIFFETARFSISAQGQPYFFNAQTKEIKWELPVEEVIPKEKVRNP
jgi:hypothetical protein